jgi:hypothetical protein
MQATIQQEHIDRYARSVAASKRVRWSIEEDVIRHRTFDTRQKFLPDGLSKVKEFAFLSDGEQRYLSQIQGRTYANIFGLVERFINAKVLELSSDHWFGDQTALEALVRFSDEELKHQELFRRIEKLAAERMPPGYRFAPQPDGVAEVVLTKSTWAVLALTFTSSCSRKCITGRVLNRTRTFRRSSRTYSSTTGKRNPNTPFLMSWSGSDAIGK